MVNWEAWDVNEREMERDSYRMKNGKAARFAREAPPFWGEQSPSKAVYRARHLCPV